MDVRKVRMNGWAKGEKKRILKMMDGGRGLMERINERS